MSQNASCSKGNLGEAGPQRFVGAQELSQILNVPKSWIYERTRQGQSAIPFLRLGAYVRFDPVEVINFFKTHSSKSMMSHKKTETTANHGSTHYPRSIEQVQTVYPLSAHTIGCRADQGQIGSCQQEGQPLAHKRRFPPKVRPDKAQDGSPKEDLIITPHYGILSSSKGDMPNGSL